MERELRVLRRRVLLLEAAIACGLVAVAGGWVPAAAPLAAQAQTVAVPFNVVGANGRVLLSVRSGDDGGGVLYVFDKDGAPVAAVGAAKNAATFRAIKDGNARASFGVSQSGDGLIEVLGPAQHRVLINTNSVSVFGETGKTIASMGLDTGGHGCVIARNKAGDEMATMAASTDGSGGQIYVSSQEGIKAKMGILQNGKGDVCASGAAGKGACLSLLAVKTMTPY